MSGVRGIARNFLAVGGTRLLLAGLAFGFYVYLQGRWDNESLGAFALAQKLFVATLPLPLLGLSFPLVRDLAQRTRPAAALVASGTALALVVAVLGAAVLGGLGMLLWPESPELQRALWLVGLALVPGALVLVAETRLTSQERLTVVAGVNTVESLLRTLLWLALAAAGLGLTALFVALLAMRLLAAAAFLRRPDLRAELAPARADRATTRYLLAMCPVFLAVLLLNLLLSRLDMIVLSKLSSLSEVGVYDRSYRLYELTLMIPSLLSTVLWPVVAREVGLGDRPVERLMHPLVRLLLVAGLPLAMLLAAFSEPIVGLLFSKLTGAEVARAALALRWLACAPVLIAIDQSLAMLLVASHRQDLDLRVLALSCLVYVTLLVLLVPRHGCVGAAAATLIGAGVQLIVRYTTVRLALRAPGLARVAALPLLAAAAMAATLVVVAPLAPLLAPFAALAAFVAAVAVLRVVTPAELLALRTAIASRRPPADGGA
jgi:O-antigen/teichoic acid export membrane protein